MLLHYWLAAHGIDPVRDARVMTVPPSQMVAALRAGQMDGFCAGEPWGYKAVVDGVGVTAASSGAIWPDHPGKVLGTSAAFAHAHPNTCRALIAAVLEAGRWIDASDTNRLQMAAALAAPDYLNTPQELLAPRILGHYQDGVGKTWNEDHGLRFHGDGAVNFPYLSDGMWFMTQHRRWGLLRDEPDYLAVAGRSAGSTCTARRPKSRARRYPPALCAPRPCAMACCGTAATPSSTRPRSPIRHFF